MIRAGKLKYFAVRNSFSSIANALTRTKIRAIVQKDIEAIGSEVKVQGWIKSVRKQGNSLLFIELYDGSCPQSLQAVVDNETSTTDLSR